MLIFTLIWWLLLTVIKKYKGLIILVKDTSCMLINLWYYSVKFINIISNNHITFDLKFILMPNINCMITNTQTNGHCVAGICIESYFIFKLQLIESQEINTKQSQ